MLLDPATLGLFLPKCSLEPSRMQAGGSAMPEVRQVDCSCTTGLEIYIDWLNYAAICA